MKRILFVDDDQHVLDGLRRSLYSMRGEWEMDFTASAPEAITLLARQPYDAVVSDIHMPTMGGTEFLSMVRKRHPQVLRIVLSGQAHRDLTLQAAASAHQYLSKPCDPASLKLAIARAGALEGVLTDPRLLALVGRIQALPSVPSVYEELVKEVRSPNGSLGSVAAIIARDTAMTAKVLQLANSAFFGMPAHVSDPCDAVLRLGLETIQGLTLTIKLFSQFQPSLCERFSVQFLAEHSVQTGFLARRIAGEIGLSKAAADNAFMGGLLHDVGQLLLAKISPEQFNQVLGQALKTGQAPTDLEREILGTTHAAIGTYLLWVWGMPDRVVEAVAYHHDPRSCPGPQPGPLTAVHIADVLSHRSGAGGHAQKALDREYLEGVGLAADIEFWEGTAERAAEELLVK